VLQHAAPVKSGASLIQENKVKPLRLQGASSLLMGGASDYLVTKALEKCTRGRQIAKVLPNDEKPASLNGSLSVRNRTVYGV